MALNWSNITDAGTFAQIPNVSTGGWFWVGMVWMIYGILFISMIPMGIEAAILGAAFAGLMISMILVYMGLASWVYTTLMFAGIIIGMFIYIMYSQK